MAQKKTEQKDVAKPVDWQELMAESAKAVAKVEKGSSDKFSLKAGQLAWQGTPLPDNQMDVVILHGTFERVLWGAKYVEGVIAPPKCFSVSLDGQHMKPHEDVPEPVNPDCDGCEAGRFHGNTPPECKVRRRLMCLPISDKATPETIAEAEIGELNIPVMSVKNWTKYVKGLSSKSLPSWAVITRVKVVPDTKSQFRVTFEPVNQVDEKLMQAVYDRLEFAQTQSLTPYDMTPPPAEEAEASAKY